MDGRYEISRLLGKGGMGEVYVARHRLLGKDVAVKFLRRDLTSDESAVKRFEIEARAAASVGHRGIIDVYDVGTSSDGAPYIVMELLDGESLRAVLDRDKPLPLGRAVAIVAELLSALAVAHAKGIVHRDLKPDNVFLERTDGPLSVKLLDFGIAKMTEGASVDLTRTGVPIGTVPYMSPEQARGVVEPDARVDVWAIGVILYQALTGCRPFESDNYSELIVKILRDEPAPLRSQRPDLPEAVETVVMRALEKDPQRRFANAADFLAALRPFAAATAAAGPSPPEVAVPVAASPEALAATAGAGSAPTMTASLSLPRRPATAAVFALAALGLVVAIVVAATAGIGRAPARRIHESSAPARTSSSSRPTAPAFVTISVQGAPEGARVYFDGALVSELPIRIAPRDTMVPIRVEAEGFETHSQIVAVSRDTTVRVALVAKTPSSPSPHPPEHRGPARRAPSGAQPLEASSPAANIQTDTREFDE